MNLVKPLKPVQFETLKTDIGQTRELQSALSQFINTPDISSKIQDKSLLRAFDAERFEGRFGEKSLAVFKEVQTLLGQPAGSEKELTAQFADTLNKNLNLTSAAFPARTNYTVSGIARNELGLPMANVKIKVFEPAVGGEIQLGKEKFVQTDANGFYSFEVEALDPKTLPTQQNELVIKAYTVGDKELLSVRQSIKDHAKLVQDFTVQQKEAAIASEFSAIFNVISPLAGDRQIADLTEKEGRTDITQLYRKTGYDARLFALMVLASRFKRDFDKLPEAARGKAALTAAHFYAWMRMGLPQDFDVLLQSSPDQKMALLKQAIADKIIEEYYDDDPNLPSQLETIARNYKTGYQISSVQELLNAWMPANLQSAFVQHFSAKADNLETAWKTLPDVQGFDTAKVEQLKSDIQLSNFLLNNAPLLTKIKQEVGVNDRNLIGGIYYRPDKWKPLIKDQPVPSFIKGDTDVQKKDHYASYLAKSLEQKYPTEVLADRVLRSDIKVAEPVRQKVWQFFQKATNEHAFDIGTTNLRTFFKQNRQAVFQGITDKQEDQDSIITEVYKLRRVYQLTANDDQAQKLLTAGYSSAAQIATEPLQAYLQNTTKNGMPTDVALGIRQKGETISSLRTLTQLTEESVKTAPYMRALNDKPSAPETPLSTSQGTTPTQEAELQQLFTSFDYCECDPCRSLTSPAAYLFDLLDFVASLPGTKKPIDVLLSRRPDIEHLPLSCDNTNKLVPYIDIVNEILGFYLAAKAENPTAKPLLDKILYLQNKEGVSQEQILSSPQYVSEKAHEILHNYRTGVNAPFERNKEYQRAYATKLGLPLYELLYAQQITSLEEDLASVSVRESSYPALFEYIQISQHEFTKIFREIGKPVSLATFYGVSQLSELTNVGTLLTKTGLTLKELNTILKSPGFDQVDIGIPTGMVNIPIDTCKVASFRLTSKPNTVVADTFWQRLYFALRIKHKLGWEWLPVLRLIELIQPDFSEVRIGLAIFNIVQHKWLLDQLGFRQTQPILIWLNALKQVEQSSRLLAKFLGLSMDALGQWQQLTILNDGTPPNLTKISEIIWFIWRYRQYKKSGLSLGELNYLFLHKFKDKKEEASHRKEFHSTIIGIRQVLDAANADYFTISADDYNEATFQRLFSLIAEGETVNKLVAIFSGKLPIVIPLAISTEASEREDAERQKKEQIKNWQEKLALDEDLSGITIDADAKLRIIHLLPQNEESDNTILEKLQTILNQGQDFKKSYLEQYTPYKLILESLQTQLGITSAIKPAKEWHQTLIPEIISKIQEAYLLKLLHQYLATHLAITPIHVNYLLTELLPSTEVFEFSSIQTAKLGKVDSNNLSILLPETAKYTIYKISKDPDAIPSLKTISIGEQVAGSFIIVEPTENVTYEWEIGVKARTKIPETLIWSIDASKFAELEVRYIQLQKWALLINKLGLMPEDINFTQRQFKADYAKEKIPSFTASFDSNLDKDLTIFWLFLMRYLELKNGITGGKISLNPLLLPPSSDTDRTNELLEEYATAWPKSLLDELVKQKRWDGTFQSLYNLNKQVYYCQQLGISLELRDTLLATDKLGDFASAFEKIVGEEAWLAFSKDINDALRPKERDALLSYVFQNKIVENCQSSDDLYEHFLVDVLMEPPVKTSRLVLATSAVQLFVQRYFMNLEKDIDIPESLLNAVEEKREEWKWRKKYRVWEANRKVLFYPENWLDPEFRTDKTELFAQLESELLQGDINTESVETALTNYVQGLMDIGRLEICGLHTERQEDGKPKMVHVIGRTYNTPHKYYYRTYRPSEDGQSSGQWSNWSKVDCQVDGTHIMPVIWQGNLFIFWLTFFEKGENAGVDQTPPKESPYQVNLQQCAEVQVAWTELRYGKWQGRKSSNLVENVFKIALSKDGSSITNDYIKNYKSLVISQIAVDYMGTDQSSIVIDIYSNKPHDLELNKRYILRNRNSVVVSEDIPYERISKGYPPFQFSKSIYNLLVAEKPTDASKYAKWDLASLGRAQTILGDSSEILSTISWLQFCLDSKSFHFEDGENYFFMQDEYHTYFIKAVTSSETKVTAGNELAKGHEVYYDPGPLVYKYTEPVQGFLKAENQLVKIDDLFIGINGNRSLQLQNLSARF